MDLTILRIMTQNVDNGVCVSVLGHQDPKTGGEVIHACVGDDKAAVVEQVIAQVTAALEAWRATNLEP